MPEQTHSGAADKARSDREEVQKAKEEMREIEEGDPPETLEEWPGGKAKYETYGGPEGETGYEEGATAKLGPSDLRHHGDGSITVGGDEVDDPDEYKGEPIPGGPTDPDAPPDPAMIGQDDQFEVDDAGDEPGGDERGGDEPGGDERGGSGS